MMAACVKNVITDTVYTSVGCNRTPQALDWGNNGLVCFAASHAVAIYDPKVCITVKNVVFSAFVAETRDVNVFTVLYSLPTAMERLRKLCTSTQIESIASDGFRMDIILLNRNYSVELRITQLWCGIVERRLLVSSPPKSLN